MPGLCYNQKVTVYTTSKQHQLDKKCNGYVAINNGDTLVQVNQIPLKPPVLPTLSGESEGIQGNEGEIFVGQNGVIPIIFLAPAGVNPSVLIIEKYYL
jgi:hypothetical protein